ncbi:MAG: hypothetical protein AAF743_02750 [Planctomycetota bacterium]
MPEWIMSPPIWVPGVCVVVGLVAAFVMRTVAKVPIVGLVLAAVGLLWFGLDLVTETPREEALRRTSTIINATADRDWQAFEDALSPRTRLPGRYADRTQFLAGAEATVDSIGLSSVTITSRKADAVDGVVDVHATVWSTQSITRDRPEKTLWRFRYVITDDGLILDFIEPLEVRGQDMSVVMQAIRSVESITR